MVLPSGLRPFLGTYRKVLFVVASEIVYGIFVDFDRPSGHSLDVPNDHLVVGMLLIVFVTLRAHVAGQVVHRAGHGLRIALLAERTDHPLDVFAVVLVGDAPLRIGHAPRRDGQVLARGPRIRRVHIQLKIRHNEQVIPQLVRKIGRIAQQRIEIAHDGDDGPCLPVALAAVLDLHERINHLMDMAPVFGKEQLASCVVVVLFHSVIAVFATVPFRPPEPPSGHRR